MTYGTIKVDTVTFTDAGIDKSVTLSGLVQNPTFSGNVTVTGTLSGVTVTGTTANFTSGNFTNISGGTHTITSGVFAAGSAANPSITFTGDLNTGIYSPGADQVAISTGGSGRLFVNASGNVGVGTSTVRANLDLGPTLAAQKLALYADATFRMGLGTQSLEFRQYTHQGASITWGNVSTSDQSTFTEQMRLASNGNLGIGKTVPSERLHIDGNSLIDLSKSHYCYTDNYGIGTPDSNGLQIFYGSSDALRIGTRNAGTFSEKFRITSAGLVGIGTTSPNSVLQVNSGTNLGGILVGFNSGSSNFYDADLQVFRTGNGTERARIDSSGRLLVGTSSDLSGGDADAKLQVNGDAGAQVLLARQDFGALTAGTLIGEVVFRSQASGVSETSALIKCEADATQGSGDKPGRLVFSTCPDGSASPVERLRINNEGYATFVAVNGVQVNSSIAAAGTTHQLFEGKHSGSAGGPSSGTRSIGIFTNGNVVNTNNSYGAISDIKLKENIVDAGSQWNDLKALQVRKYNFKESQTHTQIGLIAQEVELVSPGLVYETPDRDEDGNDLGTVTKSVNYSVLYMKAVKALQEAMERIETLEAKVAALGTP